MIYLDAYALIALLTDAPAAEEVVALLVSGGCGVAVVNLAEALDVTLRVHGHTRAGVRAALEPLLDEAIDSVSSSDEVAWLAGELRAKHYDQRTNALSLADCFLIAHARVSGDAIATSDPPVARVARAEGLTIVALPDLRGNRP